MRHLPAVAGIVLLAASAGGCAPQTYRVTVDVPAADVGGSIDSLTVARFSGRRSDQGVALTEALRNRIASEGYITVVDDSGKVTLTGAVEAGPVRSETERQSYEITVKENGKKRNKTVWVYKLRKHSLAKASYSLKQGNRTIAGNSYTTEFDQTWSGDSADAARSKAKDDESIVSEQVGFFADRIVAAISPHKEVVELELEDGSHQGLKEGTVYLQAGRLDQAMQIWEQVVQQSSSASDRAAAYYNIGVVKEAQARYADAFARFRDADMLVPATPKYVRALTRVEAAKRKQDMLQADAQQREAVVRNAPKNRP